jgi:hypothetical protein
MSRLPAGLGVQMGRTTELRRALKARFFPLLESRGFVIDQRYAPQHIDFRRSAGDAVHSIGVQWRPYGGPTFYLNCGSVSKFGLISSTRDDGEFLVPAADADAGQLPRYVRVNNRFSQVVPLWKRPFLLRRLRSADDVASEVIAALPEVEDYLYNGRVGPHCVEIVNPNSRNAQSEQEVANLELLSSFIARELQKIRR